MVSEQVPRPFVLLQARDENDPVRLQEVGCFLRAANIEADQLQARSLFDPVDDDEAIRARRGFFVGGSGDYSVVKGGPWLENACDWMRAVARLHVPTFASCFGFQTMALALGGKVVTDLARAEVGTIDLRCTEQGRNDPLFAPLPEVFPGQAGHQDVVDELPPGAVLLASSDRTVNQAFRLEGLPIYCTQFHPELDLDTLLERIRRYPEYVEKIAGIPFEKFAEMCRESLETRDVLRRFMARHVWERDEAED